MIHRLQHTQFCPRSISTKHEERVLDRQSILLIPDDLKSQNRGAYLPAGGYGVHQGILRFLLGCIEEGEVGQTEVAAFRSFPDRTHLYDIAFNFPVH